MNTKTYTSKACFCRDCGRRMQYCLPSSETHYRYVCPQCGYIDYQNPKILVACFITSENKLLWLRRRYPPMAGYWFVPSGFMELHERPEEAAARELKEETGLSLEPENLDFFLVGSIPDISEVYLAYRGEITDIGTVRVTEESLDVGFFSLEEAPLKMSAFPIAEETFRCFYRDLAAGRRTAYCAHIINGEHTLREIQGCLEGI